MKTAKSTSAFSKEELKIVNEKFKKQLKARQEQFSNNLILLQQMHEFLKVLQSIDCNSTTDGRVDYPIYSIAYNINVMYPEHSYMFIDPCLEVTNHCIQKFEREHKGWKLRFLKKSKTYYKYEKLKKHLEELAEFNASGGEITKPFGDTVMWLQDNAPEKTSFFVEELLKMCEQLISYTTITISNYSKLNLD
jgi:hypothetical protein